MSSKLKAQIIQEAKEAREHREVLEQNKRPVITADNENVLI